MIKMIFSIIGLGTLGSVCLSFSVLLWYHVYKSITKQIRSEDDDKDTTR